jgi:hypothetical protein
MSIGNEMLNLEKVVEIALKCYEPGQLGKLREANPTLWNEAMLALTKQAFDMDMQSPSMANVLAEYAEHMAEATNYGDGDEDERLEDAAFSQLFSTYVQMMNSERTTEWLAWRLLDYNSRNDAVDFRTNAKLYFHAAMRLIEQLNDSVLLPLLRRFKQWRETMGLDYGADVRRCLILIEMALELDARDMAIEHADKMKDDIDELSKSRFVDERGVAVMVKAIRKYLAVSKRPTKKQLAAILRTIRQSINMLEQSGSENPTGKMNFLALTSCAGIKRLGAVLLQQLGRKEEARAYCQSAIAQLDAACKIMQDNGKSNRYVDPLHIRNYMLRKMMETL